MVSESNDESWRERIRRVVRNRNFGARSKFDTSDVIQDTMLQAWLSGDNFDIDDINLNQALLATMARGHLHKNIRKHRTKKRDVELEQPLHDNLADDQPGPSERAISDEDSRRITAAMNRLPELERMILFRRFIAHKTFVEIGRELEIGRRKLITAYNRALVLLKREFQQPDED